MYTKEQLIQFRRITYSDKCRNYGIPEHCVEHIVDYVIYGRQPGGFLSAVFANKLTQSALRADDWNRPCLLAYAQFLLNAAPITCWGGDKEVFEWIRNGGLIGLEQEGGEDVIH